MPARNGVAIARRSGEKWAVEVLLEEHDRHYTVCLNRIFATEAGALRAGEQVVADWESGRVPARDLVLQELAAAYRRLRQTHKVMQPATVPATRSAWVHALGAWEELGWLHAAEAARYREHVRLAFESEPGAVRRHKLGDVVERSGAD